MTGVSISGYGYYELNSWDLHKHGLLLIGRNVNSVGILRQTGGAFEMGNVYAGFLGPQPQRHRCGAHGRRHIQYSVIFLSVGRSQR